MKPNEIWTWEMSNLDQNDFSITIFLDDFFMTSHKIYYKLALGHKLGLGFNPSWMSTAEIKFYVRQNFFFFLKKRGFSSDMYAPSP